MPRPIPVPVWLKRFLAPYRNAVHNYGYPAYYYLRVFPNAHFERCVVCGRYRPMLFRRSVISLRLEELWGLSPQLAEAFARKESYNCSECGTSLRGRRIAQVLLDLYPIGNPPASARSISAWSKAPSIRALRGAEINGIGGLHAHLLRLPHFISTEYQPGAAPGAMVNGVRSEDLTSLTFPDGLPRPSIDLGDAGARARPPGGSR